MNLEFSQTKADKSYRIFLNQNLGTRISYRPST